MARGYTVSRPHPCRNFNRCGNQAWGTRIYCDGCWDNMPAKVKDKMLQRAMDETEITIDVADLTHHPMAEPLKCRRRSSACPYSPSGSAESS